MPRCIFLVAFGLVGMLAGLTSSGSAKLTLHSMYRIQLLQLRLPSMQRARLQDFTPTRAEIMVSCGNQTVPSHRSMHLTSILSKCH